MDEPPRVGSWYETDDGRVFEVTAVDGAAGAIEVRYLRGALASLDAALWPELALVEIESPHQWHGSMDDFLSGRRQR
jgi:hypothetical protein